MTIDPLRCAEATVQATLVLGAVVLPPAWHALNPALLTALALMLLLLTMGTYALHAVTFDLFRLTGHRTRD